MNRLSLVALLAWLACSTTALSAAEPAARWEKTAAIDAPEAVQAAAADERYAYAINNSTIARYDRKSGKRVAASTGAAKHLNSGFLHEGKLYCAHSNYPRTPEQSELKVLDLETMRLTTSHDFGNFGGSLTWAVWHDDHWWCNFAKYGQRNAETFLVKFDDQWREQARWTYPEEMIARLGTYSVSGGIWYEGELLATDHDHRVLYRLSVPREGKALTLLGTEKSVFTGQGIAHDPLTGGLVGIDRGQQQILFSERSKK